MHATELVELAALVAIHGPVLIERVERLPESGMEQYWSGSKCRLDRWSRTLKRYSVQIHEALGPRRIALWRAVGPVVEEILLSEVLARVWTALAAAHDRFRGTSEVEPIARSVLVGQSEARNRALNIMVYGQGFGIEESVQLNRLRRRTERWTDMLLGYFASQGDLLDLAFEAERACEFAADLQHAPGRANQEPVWHLVLASIRCALQREPHRACPNADLNARIAGSLMSCIPADLFDSTGLLKSYWLLRLEAKTNDTQGMLAELLTFDQPAAVLRPRGNERGRGIS